MKRFERRGKKVVTSFEPEEVQLLQSLVLQLVELLDEQERRTDDAAVAVEGQGTTEEQGATEGEDPFAFWERDLRDDPDQPEEPDDPVLQRLFPNAYPHDPRASSDFRRFTERDARSAKVAAARVVLDGLASCREGRDPVKVPLDQTDAWLKTLTNLRLSLATRLRITDAESAEQLSELPEDDPRAFLYGVYEWLAFAQETLVQSL